jgi:hypothetical protein
VPSTVKRITLLRKPGYFGLASVALLCSPALAYLYFSLRSKDKSSPAWALAAMCMHVLFGSLPVAIVISVVATLRHRGPMWLFVVMWALIGASVLLILVIRPVSPWISAQRRRA